MESLLLQPADLRQLEADRDAARILVDQHRDLKVRLAEVQQARAQGNARMNLNVEIGPGFAAEGVVPDTSRVIVAAGVDDLFLELELDKALAFVDERISILQKKLECFEAPISRLKKEHEMVVKTLRSAFQLPDQAEPEQQS
ncbi:uncharacterized protein JCM10292_003723 [Rhodotorula paludigena]|uniref:uncharacterized protein n=1 Tax=Rhodotorula paludigena TaxID=86838 RepID=UPI00317057CA